MVLAAVSFFLASSISRLLGASEAMLPYGVLYLRINMIGIVFLCYRTCFRIFDYCRKTENRICHNIDSGMYKHAARLDFSRNMWFGHSRSSLGNRYQSDSRWYSSVYLFSGFKIQYLKTDRYKV